MAILVARTNLPVWDFQKLASLISTRARNVFQCVCTVKCLIPVQYGIFNSVGVSSNLIAVSTGRNNSVGWKIAQNVINSCAGRNNRKIQ